MKIRETATGRVYEGTPQEIIVQLHKTSGFADRDLEVYLLFLRKNLWEVFKIRARGAEEIIKACIQVGALEEVK